MSKIEIAVLASGSKANAIMLKFAEKQILIDAGLTYTKLETRCQEENIDLAKTDFVLLTHEHIDHTRGLKTLIKNHPDIKILCTQKTSEKLEIENFSYKIEANKVYNYQSIAFKTYQLSHDAVDPINFVFESQKKKISFIFDTGYIPERYYKLFENSDVIFLEFNHDIKKLMESNYPFKIKQRILSDIGHLSNEQAMLLLQKLKIQTNTIIITAHTSENSNEYAIIEKLLKDYPNTHITHQEIGCKKIKI